MKLKALPIGIGFAKFICFNGAEMTRSRIEGGSTPEAGRRELIKLAGLAAGGLMSGAAGAAYAAGGPSNVIHAQRPPLAVAMWDFSWLTRRTGAQAEFADFDAVLNGFVARGYNALRIDAFPHLIARGADGQSQDSFELLPSPPAFPWGSNSRVTINPRRDLPDFLIKCRERGIRVGLSTWLRDDATKRATAVRTPEDLGRVWVETLSYLNDRGVLDVIEWVDFSNEFPSAIFAAGPFNHINSRLGLLDKMLPLNGLFLPYNKNQAEAISFYMNMVLQYVKSVFPGLRFCFSSISNGGVGAVQHFDFSKFDCLEPHIWLQQNSMFNAASGLTHTLMQGFQPFPPTTLINAAVASKASRVYFARRDAWLAWLGSAMDTWVTLANKHRIPVYTTESWGPVNYWEAPNLDPQGNQWRWVFDSGEAGAMMAKNRGWSGICTSNFCQPNFPTFYNKIDWHRSVSARIRAV